jgi:hypothetical protein
LGVTQVLSKDALVTSTLGYTHQAGYLTNPYKWVYIDSLGYPDFEVRPDSRNSWVWSNRYIHHISGWDSALHLDYRLFADDWGIHSHTFEIAWHQPVGHAWRVTPRVRYYSQGGADFYAPFFNDVPASGHFSSDHRLAGFGAMSGGIGISKDWSDWASFEVGFDYYNRAADFEIAGDGASDFADFDAIMMNAGLKIKF